VRVIQGTYAYHPANNKCDLKVDVNIVAKYAVEPSPRTIPIDPELEWDIKKNGIMFPLKIYTNGLMGTIGDGNQRLRIAKKLGIKKVPVQFIPDNFRRLATRAVSGHPALDPVLSEWVERNLWAHENHEVSRHVIGGGNSASSIRPNKYVKCVCSCKAEWKEECS